MGSTCGSRRFFLSLGKVIAVGFIVVLISIRRVVGFEGKSRELRELPLGLVVFVEDQLSFAGESVVLSLLESEAAQIASVCRECGRYDGTFD